MKQAVQVTLLGQQYTLRSDIPPEQLQRVVAFVEEQVAKAAAPPRSGDSFQAAVLALLNVAGGYLRLCDDMQQAEQAQQRLEELAEKLEYYDPDA